MSRRVVISGLGAVTGFGYGVGPFWEAMVAGRSCIGPISLFDASAFPSRFAGEARGFSVKEYVPKSYRKAIKVMARDIELAVGAARAAVEDAGIITKALLGDGADSTPAGAAAVTYAPERVGCQIGAGLIAAEVPELAMALSTATEPGDPARFSYERWGAGGMDNLTPLWLLKYLPNMLACHVTILHDAQGPSNTITCSEASGLLSIGESTRVIMRGDADLCFSGGAESKINPMGMTRLDFARRLAHHAADAAPTSIIRPYDDQAPGSLVGEGGGIVMLEEADACLRRSGRAYAEVIGFGAGHSPLLGSAIERSEGLRAAIENALDDAELRPDAIDAIVPHASGARDPDAEEAAALRAVFGDRLRSIPLITLTPNIGETMAGAGGLAAGLGALAVKHQMTPARLHPGRAPNDLDAGPSPARDATLRNVLVCTNALGGQNAALVLRAI